MHKFRASSLALVGLAFFLSVPASAQNSVQTFPDAGRDASFLLPSAETAPRESSAMPAGSSALPQVEVPALVPPSSEAAPPPPPPPPPATSKPPANDIVGKPVESGSLSDIDPESIGLYSNSEGGLGAAMWKGTSRDVVDRLLPNLNLPVSSPVLNNLAHRFLLTTAGVPDGTSGSAQHLTAMRVEKLVMLGDPVSAWKLVLLAKPEHIDEITLRRVAETALTSSEAASVCEKLPDIMKERSSAEWQKLLLVCQLRAQDIKAAQLTLDLLRTENVKDAVFFPVVEKNLLIGDKRLPRRLTPLTLLVLALLQQVDVPVPGEVYARPEAAVIQPLLRLKSKDDNRRLELADKAANSGLISVTELEAVYSSISFTPEAISNAMNSQETDGRLRALLYQAAKQEALAPRKVDLALKYMRGTSPAGLNGTQGQVLAEMVGPLTTSPDYNASSASLALLYMMGGKPDIALEWLKHARQAAAGMPAVAAELQVFWPLTVLAGLESSANYAQNLAIWVDEMVKPGAANSDNRLQREKVASVLLLLDASGFGVPDNEWGKVLQGSPAEKKMVPDTLLVERLRAAGVAGHRGETVLLSLLVANNLVDGPLTTPLAIIRSLRAAGLTADAATLARELATTILMAPVKS